MYAACGGLKRTVIHLSHTALAITLSLSIGGKEMTPRKYLEVNKFLCTAIKQTSMVHPEVVNSSKYFDDIRAILLPVLIKHG